MKNSHIQWLIVLLAILFVGVMIYSGSPKSAVNDDVATQKQTEPTLAHVHGFAVDVLNPNRLFIATHHGLLKFEDTMLSKIGTVSDDLMGFSPHPSDPSVFYSSGHPTTGGSLGFQKSTDGGLTWQKISNGLNGPVDFHSMTISTVNPDVVYGYFGGLQLSTNAGKTWKIVTNTIQPYSLTTDPKLEGVVYAATARGVMVSEDYGTTWKSYAPELETGAVSAFAFSFDGTYALAFSQVLGGLGKTTDNGASWSKIDESFGGQSIMFIAHSKTHTGTVYALTQTYNIYKSVDEGQTWIKLR